MKKTIDECRALGRRYISTAQAMGNVYGIERDGLPFKRTISLFGPAHPALMEAMPDSYRELQETDFDWAAA